MSREGALWIGGLESYMDEEFIQRALQVCGEVAPISIKIMPPPQVMKNKFSSAAAGYGFINFANDQTALTVMHKLNGKMMPNTNPPVRWKLNHSSNRLLPGEKNHSVWVGDLTPEVDDLQLYQFFSRRFQSLVSAKVVLDDNGFSKGFGFIRFSNEVEQQTAMSSMNGMSGLGGKPIKVSVAVNKIKDGLATPQVPDHISQAVAKSVVGGPPSSYNSLPPPAPAPNYPANNSAEYYQYWQNYQTQWQAYQQQWYQWQQSGGQSGATQGEVNSAWNSKPEAAVLQGKGIFCGRHDEEVDHKQNVDVDKENMECLANSVELWSSLESSGWRTNET